MRPGAGTTGISITPSRAADRFSWSPRAKGGIRNGGAPARSLKPGDVVRIPAGVKHWHGAARDSELVHVAIAVPGEGASNEWLEPVAEEGYEALTEIL